MVFSLKLELVPILSSIIHGLRWDYYVSYSYTLQATRNYGKAVQLNWNSPQVSP